MFFEVVITLRGGGRQFFEDTDLAALAHLEKGKGYWLSNHDKSFHACAFIIRLHNPIYASIIVFFRLDNKKEKSFFKEICRDYLRMCSFCCIFVADLRRRSQ